VAKQNVVVQVEVAGQTWAVTMDRQSKSARPVVATCGEQTFRGEWNAAFEYVAWDDAPADEVCDAINDALVDGLRVAMGR
jgi:hypothetical protein